NMSYLSPDLREVMEKAVETTKDNIGPTLNVCFPYTSRDELTTSIKKIVKMVEKDQLKIKDIDENLIEQNLFTHGSPPLEVLIRTSGEIRLSDFLLWQCHQNCYIYFVKCYWPEFSFWEMLPIILDYQVNYESIKEKREKSWHHLSRLYNDID
ncbi:4945_t:CDS:2, partial [Acaulospora morrowiae]